MDVSTFYTLFKFLHVTAAIVWIGGACAISLLNVLLARQQQGPTLAALAQASGLYGRLVIGPSVLLTLAAGIGMVVTAGLDASSLWIVWGLIGLAGSFVMGAVLSRRLADQVTALAATAPSSDARLVALQRRLTTLNALNLLLLLSVVWAMIAKPTL
ncbi:MAG TPA: DUF2269 family protein [Caldilineaceae bacterium]|nr:DUF2269 family protein [Caldilineaceae bacterium]